jgi:hypothetical protein
MAVKLNVAENRYMIANSENGRKKVTPEEHMKLEDGKEVERLLEIARRERKRLEIYHESLKN